MEKLAEDTPRQYHAAELFASSLEALSREFEMATSRIIKFES